jgi:mannose-6-phosphate isomerase-like protein (cupin superfamily)
MRSSPAKESAMPPTRVNFADKFSKFHETFSPRVVAKMNDYEFKLARALGEFVWHKHDETDETFVIIDGELTIDFRDGEVRLGAGEMLVIPKGVEHRPRATEECRIMLIEPAGTVNTGDAGGELTAKNDVWI